MNPFEFSYKVHPESSKATMVSRFSSYMERFLLIIGVIIIAVVVLDTPNNWGEAVFAALLLLGGSWYIHKNKESWCESFAGKGSSNKESNTSHNIHSSNPQRFCSNCGSPLESGDHFCTKCGNKV